VTSGARLEELAQAWWGNLLLGTQTELPLTWVLSVTGKRNKTRDVPLAYSVVELLRQHAGGFREGEEEGGWTEADGPLMFALSRCRSGDLWKGKSARSPWPRRRGRTFGPGIYALLKQFFGRAAASAGEAGLKALRLVAASTHRMRHTFARQSIVDGAL
jgi:integrase